MTFTNRAGFVLSVSTLSFALILSACTQGDEGSARGKQRMAAPPAAEKDKREAQDTRSAGQGERSRQVAPDAPTVGQALAAQSEDDQRSTSSVAATVGATPTPEAVQEPMVRAIEPNRVKKGELTTLAIGGKHLEEAKVIFRSATQEIPMQVDAITAGEEILLMDRNFQEFAAGTYDLVIEVKGKRLELKNALTVEE